MTELEHWLLMLNTALTACVYALVVLGCFTDRGK